MAAACKEVEMTFSGKGNILRTLGNLIIFAAEIPAYLIRYNKDFCRAVFNFESLLFPVLYFADLAAGNVFYRQVAVGFGLCVNFYLCKTADKAFFSFYRKISHSSTP